MTRSDPFKVPDLPSGFVFDEAARYYAFNHVPVLTVSEVCRESGIAPPFNFGSPADRARWQDEGTSIHLATEYDDRGILDERAMDDALRARVVAWRRFRKETGFTPRLIEARLFNERWNVTGRIDREGSMTGFPDVVLDIKRGPIQDWVGIALAGYDFLLPPAVSRRLRLGVELRPDATYSIRKFVAFEDRNTFLAALSVVAWRRLHNKS